MRRPPETETARQQEICFRWLGREASPCTDSQLRPEGKGASAALSCLFLLCTKVLSASHSVAEFFLIMSDSATPWTVACQTPLSVEFSRQEYWSGLPCPPPGRLPGPGIEPLSLVSPASVAGFFTATTAWEACWGAAE